MFGYININEETLPEEGKKAYRAYYCGLCRKLKENCGTKGQMLLAYDMTFLIVLLSGLYELPGEKETFTCALHPAKKRAAFLNEATDYAADMNLILGYYHLLDDWKDEKNSTKKRMADRLQADYEKAAERFPRQDEAIRQHLLELSKAEEEQVTDPDVVSGIFGELLAEIFAWKDDEWHEELHCFGFYLGKFIYLMDAYEDLPHDKKTHAYNPFRTLAREKSQEEYETLCKCYMTSQISECARSFERLPVLQHAEIIRNILYSGVWSKYEILQKKKKKKEKK